MENQNEKDLNLLDLVYYFRKKIFAMIAAFVLCGGLGFCITQFFMTPKYTASTRVYVLSRSSEATVVYADYQTSTQMLNDYKVLITGQNVTEEVIARLGLDCSPKALASMIEVNSPENTRFVQINVTSTDPQQATDIANMVREIASMQITELMDVDAVNLVYEADVPQEPVSPNLVWNTAIAAFVGLICTIAVLVIVYLLDDTIRTEDDVERYLGLSIMGVIPVSDQMDIFGRKSAKTSKISKKHARKPAGPHVSQSK